MIQEFLQVQKTADIHPPKTGIPDHIDLFPACVYIMNI